MKTRKQVKIIETLLKRIEKFEKSNAKIKKDQSNSETIAILLKFKQYLLVLESSLELNEADSKVLKDLSFYDNNIGVIFSLLFFMIFFGFFNSLIALYALNSIVSIIYLCFSFVAFLAFVLYKKRQKEISSINFGIVLGIYIAFNGLSSRFVEKLFENIYSNDYYSLIILSGIIYIYFGVLLSTIINYSQNLEEQDIQLAYFKNQDRINSVLNRN